MSYKSGTKKKFYAVAVGRKPGIYTEWFGKDGAEEQIRAFPGARFKGFLTMPEAHDWLKKSGEPTAYTPPQATKQQEQPAVSHPANKVIIYTDGGCLNNPGPGGYGVVMSYNGKRKELSGGFKLTTNNRMELTACIEALKALKISSSVLLYSDSQYVVNGITKGWAARWRAKNWMRAKDSPAENADLWSQLLELTAKHDVEFSWVRGHAGQAENERCDVLAKQAAQDVAKQGRDRAYETNRTQGPAALFEVSG